MFRKWMTAAVSVSVAIGFLFIMAAGDVSARRGKKPAYTPPPKQKAPVAFQLERAYNLSDAQIKERLLAGWELGGVYRECGDDFGKLEVTADIEGALIPVYKILLQQVKDDMLALLEQTQKPARARQALDRIIAGKEKLTKYGSLDKYISLQKQFEKLNGMLKYLKPAPAISAESTRELLAKIEKFINTGEVTDVNGAKKAIQKLGNAIARNPKEVIDAAKGVNDNLAALDNVRKLVKDATEKAAKLGDGCRMAYLFYLPKY